MQMESEINLMVDEYINVEFELDVDKLAEELAINHDFVDDVRMGEYFHSHVEDMVQDEISELRVNVAHAQAEFEGELQDLSDQVKELQPDNNYVRINDLRDVIDAQIDLRVAGILNDVMKGIEQQR